MEPPAPRRPKGGGRLRYSQIGIDAEANIHSLPADALIEILLMLSLTDVLCCAQVSQGKLWRLLYLKRWRIDTLSRTAQYQDLEPRKLYITKYGLEKNWANARCSHKRFVAHPNSSVNGIKSSDWLIATASDDASIKVWNIGGGFGDNAPPPCTVMKPKIHSLFDSELNHNVQSFVFAVDMDTTRSLLVSGGLDENVHVWDNVAGTSRGIIPLVHRCGVFHVHIHGSSILSCGGRDSYLKVSDVETLKVVRHFEYNSGLYSFTLMPDHNVVAGGGPSGTLRLWDYNSGEEIHSTRGYHPLVHLTAHGNILAYADQEGMVAMHDIRTMRKLYDVKERTSLRDVVFDATKIVTCTKDNQINVYSLPDRTLLARFSDTSLYCLDLDDRRLVCGDREGRLHVWDYQEMQEMEGIPPAMYYCNIL